MAKIKIKNSLTSGLAPAGLSLGEVAINIPDKKIYVGNVVESAVVLIDGNNLVTSINGFTGAITNVARTNEGNTFSVQQVFNAGITASSTSNVLDIIATTDGCGLRIAQAASGSNARVGGIRLGKSTSNSTNSYIENYVGILKFFNGISGTNSTPGLNMFQLSTTNAQFGVPIDGATFSSLAGEVKIQKSGYVGSDSAYLRIVGADSGSSQYNSDIRANASASTNTIHTLPALTGTLLNTASSYVISVNGSTGAVTIATGLSWSAVTADRSLVAEEGVLANKSSGTLTLTLPTTAALGKVIRVSGMQNTWRIAQNASQKIHFGKVTTTTGAGGYLESSNAKDAVELVCCVANTEWNVISSIGNITIV